MSDQVTIDMDKPDTSVKDGTDVNIKGSEGLKQDFDVSSDNPVDLKSGAAVNIKSTDNPKTW